jgi:hypothetical protein
VLAWLEVADEQHDRQVFGQAEPPAGGAAVAGPKALEVNAGADHADARRLDPELDRLLGDVRADGNHAIGSAEVRRHHVVDRTLGMLAEQAVGGDDDRQPQALSAQYVTDQGVSLQWVLDVHERRADRAQEVAIPQQLAQPLTTRAVAALARKVQRVPRQRPRSDRSHVVRVRWSKRTHAEHWAGAVCACSRRPSGERVGRQQVGIHALLDQPFGQGCLVSGDAARRPAAQFGRQGPDEADAKTVAPHGAVPTGSTLRTGVAEGGCRPAR